jgi:hypothetical protein
MHTVTLRGILALMLLLSATVVFPEAQQSGSVTVSGPTRVWHPVTLDVRGPTHAETDTGPNPFLDYRLQVLFRGPSGRQYNVPGFFDGDGAGGTRGNVWRARFSPDEPGQWQYTVSFRSGPGVAVAVDNRAGGAVSGDGQQGTLTVGPRDPAAPGFLKLGRLEYVGKHYLKFRDGGYWISGGTNEPENFLAYEGFDNTPPSHSGWGHKYADHVADWRPGDPDWGNGRGKGIIGAINYLASKKTNTLFFLPMNIGGDGKDVWPFAGKPDPLGSPTNDNLHYDVAKLAQWEIVFAHAQRQGLFLHVVFNEAEQPNKLELDNGELGPERKLFYREMIARFGHHLAMQWNLSEEYNARGGGGGLGGPLFTPAHIRQFADYVRTVDSYAHPITVHPLGDPIEVLRFTFGDPRFSTTSIQTGARRLETLVDEFRRQTAAAGRPLPISIDEFIMGNGLPRCGPPETVEACRKQRIWPVYLSGGTLEIILSELLETDSFKNPPSKETIWDQMWYARSFVEQLPFPEMEPMDGLVQGAGIGPQVFVKPNEVYAIYLPIATPSGSLNLENAPGPFELTWYNPRTGRFVGQPRPVSGGGMVELGAPPSDPGEDWAVLVRGRK